MAIHVAIMREPYLSYILDGSKTIESRFTKNKCAPYQAIKTGDMIYFKKSGGKIVAIAMVSSVKFYVLSPGTIDRIFDEFGQQLRITGEFVDQKRDSKYCTLAWITGVKKIDPPISFEKRDQRAWIIFKSTPPFLAPAEQVTL
jgi:ASC-1-like (ASCH) protein